MKNSNFIRPLSTLILVALVMSNAFAVKTKPLITDEDKAEVIQQVLIRELIANGGKDELGSDYEFMRQSGGGIILSTKGIKPKLIPQIPEVMLVTLTPREIQERANRGGGFMYLSFTQFEVRGSKIVVALARVWALSEDSRIEPMSGGANVYEFRKRGKKWRGRKVAEVMT